MDNSVEDEDNDDDYANDDEDDNNDYGDDDNGSYLLRRNTQSYCPQVHFLVSFYTGEHKEDTCR